MSMLDDIPLWKEEHVSDKICAIRTHGETLTQIYSRCTEFYDEAELAKAVRHCVSLGRLVKVGQRYYLAGLEPAIEQRPTQVADVQKRIRTKPQRKYGRMLPMSDLGKVALTLCVLDRHLTSDEVSRFTKLDKIYVHLAELCRQGYAYRRGVKVHTYCWSKTIDYPFASLRDSDFEHVELPEHKVNTLKEMICRGT